MDKETIEDLKLVGMSILLGFLIGLMVVYYQTEVIKEQIHESAITNTMYGDGKYVYNITLVNIPESPYINVSYNTTS